MRPTRLLLSVCFVFVLVILTVYSLISSHSSDNAVSASSDSKGGMRALFSWSMPSTLFPQSAIISLTDDNSTFFLSRPAAYGPRLPTDGLSGQLWIGSGFSEDLIIKGAISQAEGELGCSDIPDWDQRQVSKPTEPTEDAKSASKDSSSQSSKHEQENEARNGALGKEQEAKAVKKSPQPKEDDGTDDYLHWPLPATFLNKYNKPGKSSRPGKSEHADIQSLQESAEIAGKVVLLSRGGCGFLEKTKWVQRRGGVALVVGDNTRGGPLTIMYGSGDASNISIPSVFTTRTTAHLLSSLMPDGTADGNEGTTKIDEVTAKLTQTIKDSSKPNSSPVKVDSPNASPQSKESGQQRSPPRAKMQKRSSPSVHETKKAQVQQSGWFSWLSRVGLNKQISSAQMTSDSSRPPSSGQLQWIVSEDWDDEPVAQNSKNHETQAKQANVKAASGDNFVIGVQDWRDPDMMKKASSAKQNNGAAVQDSKLITGAKVEAGSDKKLSGGSHTPGSGIYHSSGSKISASESNAGKNEVNAETIPADADDKGWLSRIFGGSEDEGKENSELGNQKAKEVSEKIAAKFVKEIEFQDSINQAPTEHEGLWVTLTPTTVSTTPFFDTLLVLVVSPLVTLTIVYALLLLRSRIRRRRWRAPKSVVDRLPVRTYHTISYSSSSTSSQPSSPENSSPTSPLLQTRSKSITSRSRPRSRTTSTIAEHVSISLDKATARTTLANGERKRSGPKRYNGRQSECVVCLEEYVDGQSRVMSLPCGHEFHAECITPWLTTRRRTCPICKGDVVRSLADSSNYSSTTDIASAANSPDHVTADDVQVEAAQTRNDSASSAIPIPRGPDDSDLERGDDLAATLVNDQSVNLSSSRSWRELAARSLSAVRGEGWRQNPATDRDR